jgi:hypothetical protein
MRCVVIDVLEVPVLVASRFRLSGRVVLRF